MSAYIRDTLLPSSNDRGRSIDKSKESKYNPKSVELFSIEGASYVLKVSRATVYRLINSGQLVAKKLGSRTMVTADAISDFIDNLEEYEGGRNVF